MTRTRLESWDEVGSRVALARQRAGFTQDDLARRLGLHRSAITRIEQGRRQLDALELAALADTFGRSVEWFVTTPPPSIASHRTGLSAEPDVARLEDELERTARDVELLQDIGVLKLESQDLPSGVTSLAEAQDGAAKARQLLDIPHGPILDLSTQVQKLGLLGFSFDLGPAVVDGAYVRVGDAGVALVNGSADPGRRRFTLAHELGHHLLADEYTAEFGMGASRDERESLIDAFAIHFLMPSGSIRARWNTLADELQDSRRQLIVLAAEYRVSWSAAISHATSMKLIDRTEHGRLEASRPTRADYLELGIGFGEELTPPALPPAYAQAAMRAYRQGVISSDRAIELLRGLVDEDDLPDPHEIPIEALRSDFDELH